MKNVRSYTYGQEYQFELFVNINRQFTYNLPTTPIRIHPSSPIENLNIERNNVII